MEGSTYSQHNQTDNITFCIRHSPWLAIRFIFASQFIIFPISFGTRIHLETLILGFLEKEDSPMNEAKTKCRRHTLRFGDRTKSCSAS